MRLCYWDAQPNFGDALNPWLFERLLPGVFDAKDDVLFLGIGTILGHAYSRTARKVVFGSGYALARDGQYGPKPELDETWEVVCVRGPLTAEVLGLPADSAVTDAAALLRFADLPPRASGVGPVFMPHLSSLPHHDWSDICAEAGVTYADPRRPVEEFLGLLRGAEVVVAEAMHAAIVADTLRVPWVPVRAYPTVNAFKWRDWTASLDLPYEPRELPALESEDGRLAIPKRRWVPRPFRKADAARRRARMRDRAVRALREAACERPVLSEEAVFSARTSELRTRLRSIRD